MVKSVKLSIVAPVYNEEDSILEFAKQLRIVLDSMKTSYEVILVNDGSSDTTLEKIKNLKWAEKRVISFVSNSGQVSAVDAGYRASNGEYVIAMDSDLQHPVELIPELVAKAESENLDVVYCVRPDRSEERLIKRLTAKLYYKTIRFLSDVNIEDSASEYRLVSKRVITAIRALPPGKRMIRLLVAGFNFPSGTLPYVAHERYAGQSKYSFRSLINLAGNSIVGFSIKPLKLSVYLGLFVTLLSVLGFGQAIYSFFQTNRVPGWTSMMASMFALFGVMFIILGVMGVYLGRVVEYVNKRPDYILDEKNSDK